MMLCKFLRNLASPACALALFLLSLFSPGALAQQLNKDLLLRTLAVGGIDQEAMARVVEDRHVDFLTTPEVEKELRAAGASDALIEAIRKSGPPVFRESVTGSASAGGDEGVDAEENAAPLPEGRSEAGRNAATPGNRPPPGRALPSLQQSQILIALQSGASPAQLAEMVAQRGIGFRFTPEIGREFQSAGADATLLAALAIAKTVAGPGVSGRPDATVPPASTIPEGYIPLPLARAKDFDPHASQGRIDLRIYVDGSSEIRIQGEQVIHKALSARPGRNAGTEYTHPLPAEALRDLRIRKRDGRGSWAILQQPSPENNHTLVLRIDDPKGGEDRYHLQIEWGP